MCLHTWDQCDFHESCEVYLCYLSILQDQISGSGRSRVGRTNLPTEPTCTQTSPSFSLKGYAAGEQKIQSSPGSLLLFTASSMTSRGEGSHGIPTCKIGFTHAEGFICSQHLCQEAGRPFHGVSKTPRHTFIVSISESRTCIPCSKSQGRAPLVLSVSLGST